MAYEQVILRDIVDRAVAHNWSIPEFQRGFVWKATQVRDLAESLWYGHRLGFEGMNLLADFRPQWHHIFPKKHLEGEVDESLVDALANVAVIGPEINIRISAKDPMSYIDKYKITSEKLAQQFVDPGITGVSPTAYETWLRGRAQRLAEEGNSFLKELRGTLS